ncbi:F-box protein [Brasilonema sp. CT11]|nr:F-box protein [Brasilonema sp. CT11]
MDYFSGYIAVQDSLFITIPSELVAAVFGYLAAKDLVVCSSVCRKWRQYSSYGDVWKALCYVSRLI